MPSLAWYLQRLTAMPPAEIPWRAWRLTRGRLGRYCRWPSAGETSLAAVWRGKCLVELLRSRSGAVLRVPDRTEIEAWPPAWREAVLAEAEDLLAHRATFFALDREPLGKQIDWNRDYASGKTVPLDYAPDLDYRDPDRVGDVKHVWELGRMQHLTRLAQAWVLTQDSRFAKEVVDQITDWIDQCPFMQGIHWTSPMEAGLRMITWTWAFHLIRDWTGLDNEFCSLLVRSIHLHLVFIDRNYSLFSSANNHLIAEASGAFVAASYWSGLKCSERCKRRARKHLIRECQRQNYADGVNKEQTFGYQFFVWDLFLVPALIARDDGEDFPHPYWDRLERMTEFLACVSDGNGNTPSVGDEDDGLAIDLGGDRERPILALLNTAGAIWNRKDFREWAGSTVDEKTTWLVGMDTHQDSTEELETARSNRSFPYGGYHVLRYSCSCARQSVDGSEGHTDFSNDLKEQPANDFPHSCPLTLPSPTRGEGIRRSYPSVDSKEVLLLFDVGPLGWPATAAHAHADALSVLLHLGGQPVLIDPGTYSYQDTAKRHFYRATAQHNTLCFGENDQAEYLNRFMWGKRPRVELLRAELTVPSPVLEGQVTWWTGAYHRRKLVLDPRSCRIEIEDAWEGPEPPTIGFCLHPELSVTQVSDAVAAHTEHFRVTLRNGSLEGKVVGTYVSPRCYLERSAQKVRFCSSETSGQTRTEITWQFG